MPVLKNIFFTTAFLEAGVAVLLLSLPALIIQLLFGISVPSPEALMVGRVAGAALLAIGVACWFARDDSNNSSKHALLCGMLTYNAGACLVLFFAGAVARMAGVVLWPAVVLHAALFAWCVVALKRWTIKECY